MTILRDWIGWGADAGWTAKATNWFNELVQYVRSIRADLTAHKETADWTDGGLTFSRDATNSSTRISDIYSATRQVFFGAVRVTLDSLSSKTEYMDNGATVIGQWHRDTGYFELARTEEGTVTLASGWANFGATDTFASCYIDANGFVHIEGRISKTSTGTAASGTVFATLPAGFRPARRHSSVGRTNSGGQQPVAINVETNGDIKFFDMAGSGVAQGSYVTMGASFYVGH